MALGSIYRVIQDIQGNIVPEVLCTVLLSGTSTLATLFADQDGTVSLPNPLANNSTYGSYSLFVGAGLYDMQFVKAGYTFETQRNISVRDPAAGVNQLLGTANQVLVSPGSGIGVVTLSLPQSIAPDSSVQFATLGLGTPAPGGGVRLAVNGNMTAGGTQLASLAVDTNLVFTDIGADYVGFGTSTPLARISLGAHQPANVQSLHLYQAGTQRFGFGIGVGEFRTFVADGSFWTLGALSTTDGFTLNEFMRYVTSFQRLGLLTTNPQYVLHVNGNAGTPGGLWVNSTSTRRLKQAIQALADPFALLDRLQPRQWAWADDQPELAAQLPGLQAGFVLEEVAAVKPAWAPVNAEGTPGLAMRGLDAYLVAAVQILRTRLQALEAR